jgi:hypothetical protein
MLKPVFESKKCTSAFAGSIAAFTMQQVQRKSESAGGNSARNVAAVGASNKAANDQV